MRVPFCCFLSKISQSLHALAKQKNYITPIIGTKAILAARTRSPNTSLRNVPQQLNEIEVQTCFEEEDEKVNPTARPEGREVLCSSANHMERLAVTSSVVLEICYNHGFEEWKPSQSWRYDDELMRIKVRDAFRANFRTAIFTATDIAYTELLEMENSHHGVDELPIEGIIFTKNKRVPGARPKFLIRLQHALEHHLAMALHRANFTRISGETTPMYVFLSQYSGKEIRLQSGKEIINYQGVVPHVKVRCASECHLEMVPSEKSFLKQTLRDLINNGKQKAYLKDTRSLVKTRVKLIKKRRMRQLA